MPDQVTPGPCPPTGCPAPTEIDCIIVDKVYASCAQTVNATGTFKVPNCTGPITCAVDLTNTSCTVGAITPTGTDDINNITYVIGAVLDLTCANGTTTTETLYTTVTVPLYNPSGTTPSCTILSGSCTCVVLPTICDSRQDDPPPANISCTVSLCLLAQTTAAVQILVPTYGFCVPGPCAVGPVLPCPPTDIYPPQMGM
jgi:hypothetical protein